jgi:hypothetical protein
MVCVILNWPSESTSNVSLAFKVNRIQHLLALETSNHIILQRKCPFILSCLAIMWCGFKKWYCDMTPERGNSIQRSVVARQRLGKHVPAATNCHTTIEELLEAVFSVGPTEQIWLLLRKTNPSSRRGRGPISKHVSGLGTNKVWSWVPTGPETKNDCAGEGQEQISALLSVLLGHTTQSESWHRDIFSWIPGGLKPRIVVLEKASSKLLLCSLSAHDRLEPESLLSQLLKVSIGHDSMSRHPSYVPRHRGFHHCTIWQYLVTDRLRSSVLIVLMRATFPTYPTLLDLIILITTTHNL